MRTTIDTAGRIVVPKALRDELGLVGGEELEIIVRDRLPERARTLGDYFLEELRAIKSEKIREARGLGLMIGIELKEKVGPSIQALMENGVIALLAGATVIRLLPPLVITREEIDLVLSALKKALA